MAEGERSDEESSREGPFKPLESRQSLWAANSAWRNVAIGACCLASATVGVPLLRAHYQSVATMPPADVAPVGNAQVEPAPQACALRSPDVGQDLSGRVAAFLTAQEALEMIQFNEANLHGNVSPDYLTQRRVRVEIGLAGNRRFTTVIVPDGVSVQVGDTVKFIGVHRARGLPCHYIPPLISGIIAPEAGRQ
jgi:hypothetical protein